MTESNIIPCDTATFAVSDIKTLLLLLNSPEPSICVNAMESLTKYADQSPKNRLQLLSLRITKPLIELSQSKDVNIRRASVGCIAAITESNETHPDLRKRELIEVLIASLSTKEAAEVQDEAAYALANLAKDFANKSDIRKSGGIRALIKVLESPDPDVKKNAGLALSTLLDDFANRAEIRYINGIGPLLELLSAEYNEILDNALNSLIRCAEDHGNRIEIRKQNGLKKLVDLLSQEILSLQPSVLQCIATCLEDSESCNSFADTGGLPVLVKLAGTDDLKIKKMVGTVLHKLARSDRNVNYLREAGVLGVLFNNLGHFDPGTVSSSAYALCNIAKNEINQIELNKMGIVDTITKLLSHEDLDVRRQSVTVLSSLFSNMKIRSKIRSAPDCLPLIIKLLQVDDEKSIVNGSESISTLAEDSANRSDFIKGGCVQALLSTIEKTSQSVQSMACLALARCLQDNEAQIILSKTPNNRGILRLIELLGSTDVNVCRHAAYSLSNACQLDVNAISACNSKALEALISLVKDTTKNALNFATDAIDRVLNYHVSAKYWLKNELTSANQIADGFYDMGSSGPNLEAVHNFPSLVELQQLSPDKKREIVLIDWTNDVELQNIFQEATEHLSLRSPQKQLRQIAQVVSRSMGGVVDQNQVGDFSYKFHISEIKFKLNSNVIPIGQIRQGTFYHRSLLFKAICDRIGLAPCTLIRGDFNRAWNIVDVKKQSLNLKNYPKPVESAPVAPAAAAPVSTPKDNKDNKDANKRPPSRATVIKTGGGNTATNAPTKPPSPSTQGRTSDVVRPKSVPEDDEEEEEKPVFESAIIDLMFEPGRLLIVGSPQANAYQRM